jgi:flavin reductase (DIM6/NTAB) family NADH-FMN oxidoreductase RutF
MSQGIEPTLFKSALGRFASGVTVVTVVGPEGDHGMTASSFASVSLSPPLVLVCVKKGNATHGLLEAAGRYAINLLGADQVSVSNRFAGWWEAGRSKWDDLTIERAPHSGAALIGGSLVSLDCALHERFDAGDHSIFVGRVVGAWLSEGESKALSPLLYFAGGYRSIGPAL